MRRFKGNPGGNQPRRQPVGGKPRRACLRIVGGTFRGRKLLYRGDRRVRPMKDRVREAVFNRVGPAVQGMHAIDLFAGTGALALEAISRGAGRATLVEEHRPTAAMAEENIGRLGVESRCRLVRANVFAWHHKTPDLGSSPWLVFCSPPYDFYIDRIEAIRELLGQLIAAAPPESVFVIESDARFDFAALPEPDRWDVRSYPPARVGIYRKPDQ